MRNPFSRQPPERPQAKVEPGLRIYAVGDIHGRLDLLEKLSGLIRADLANARPRSSLAVFLGDYMDRGPASRGVIEALMAEPPLCDRQVFLRGNHEAVLLDVLGDASVMAHWSQFGGLDTLRSYGVELALPIGPSDFERLRGQFAERLPDSHRTFLAATRLSYETADYFFVHAGVRPGIELSAQTEEDLLWIRKPFLNSPNPASKVVVHGHTPMASPELLAHRINVDTGAFMTGKLTCVVLEDTRRRILMT